MRTRTTFGSSRPFSTPWAIPACVLVYVPVAIPSRLLLEGPPPAEPLVVAGMLMYFFAFEAFAGWTPGKRLLGLRVVRRDGGQAGAGAIAARNLLRPLDYLPAFYLLGMCTMLATGARRQRLGDLVAGTVVLPVAAVEAPPPRTTRLTLVIGAVGIGLAGALGVALVGLVLDSFG